MALTAAAEAAKPTNPYSRPSTSNEAQPAASVSVVKPVETSSRHRTGGDANTFPTSASAISLPTVVLPTKVASLAHRPTEHFTRRSSANQQSSRPFNEYLAEPSHSMAHPADTPPIEFTESSTQKADQHTTSPQQPVHAIVSEDAEGNVVINAPVYSYKPAGTLVDAETRTTSINATTLSTDAQSPTASPSSDTAGSPALGSGGAPAEGRGSEDNLRLVGLMLPLIVCLISCQ
jgi:hypothetical protein